MKRRRLVCGFCGTDHGRAVKRQRIIPCNCGATGIIERDAAGWLVRWVNR